MNTNILDSLKGELSSLINKRAALVSVIDNDIEAIKRVISYYERDDTLKPVLINRDSKSIHTSFKDAALNVILKEATDFITTDEVAEKLISRNYKKENRGLNGFKIQVSSILSSWKSKGEIVSYRYGTSKKDNVWGKKEWLDENGKPKSGYFNNVINEEKK